MRRKGVLPALQHYQRWTISLYARYFEDCYKSKEAILDVVATSGRSIEKILELLK